MKADISKKDLQRILQLATRCTVGRTGNLSNLALWAKEGRLFAGATNLDTGIVTSAPATIWMDGELTVNAITLTKFVTSLPSGSISLETNPKTHKLLVSIGSSRSTFNTMSRKDYPELPEMPETGFFTVDNRQFCHAVKRTVFCAAKEETRPILTGLHMTLLDGKLTVMAADGFRLAMTSFQVESPDAPNGLAVTIPAKSMNEVARLAGEHLKIAITENRAIFESDGVTVASQILQGKYPDLMGIIPTYPDTLTVNRQEAETALQSIRVFRRYGAIFTDLHIDEHTLTISTRIAEVAEGHAQVDCQWTRQKPLQISFNGDYLGDILEAMSDEKATIYFGNGSQPCLFKTEQPDWLSVLMPMHQVNPSNMPHAIAP